MRQHLLSRDRSTEEHQSDKKRKSWRRMVEEDGGGGGEYDGDVDENRKMKKKM